MKAYYKNIIIALIGLFVVSCADLQVENLNEPNRKQAITNPTDLVSLLGGTTTSVFQKINDVYAVFPAMLADQTSTTNMANNFWNFSEQPRLRMNNSPSYPASFVFAQPWSVWNRGISTANTLIGTLENEGIEIKIDGVDITNEVLAGSYFLRAVSQGYLGLTFDKAYIVNTETDLSTLELSAYSKVIDASIADFDKVIELVSNDSDFRYSALPGASNVWLKDEFIDIVNSFAAKILANMPRTFAEASNEDHWARVKSYATKGIGGTNSQSDLEHFIATSVGPSVFVHDFADWSTYVLSDLAGYLPSDQKLAHLLDPINQPADYPATGVLDPIVSNDPRSEYLFYTASFGYLRADRNRSLFTNHWNFRFYSGNDWYVDGYPIPYITGTEMDYIRAEAEIFSGSVGTAAQILNTTPAGSESMDSFSLPVATILNVPLEIFFANSGNTFSGNESVVELQWTLLKEYSIELDLMGGYGLQWYMMRRHDLLQPGTPLHFAVPGGELELLGIPLYTFGGAGNETEVGTASGSNSWKNLYSKLPVASKALGMPSNSLHTSEKQVELNVGVKNSYNPNLGIQN